MKMKKLGLLFMMLCMVFAVNAQELKKGDKLRNFATYEMPGWYLV